MARSVDRSLSLEFIARTLGESPNKTSNQIIREMKSSGVSFRRKDALADIASLKGKEQRAPKKSDVKGGFNSSLARSKEYKAARAAGISDKELKRYTNKYFERVYEGTSEDDNLCEHETLVRGRWVKDDYCVPCFEARGGVRAVTPCKKLRWRYQTDGSFALVPDEDEPDFEDVPFDEDIEDQNALDSVIDSVPREHLDAVHKVMERAFNLSRAFV